MWFLEVRLKLINLGNAPHTPHSCVAHNCLQRAAQQNKYIFFLHVAMVVRYICPAALILHPVTLMIQSTQYKY